jgi:hypothetical protein
VACEARLMRAPASFHRSSITSVVRNDANSPHRDPAERKPHPFARPPFSRTVGFVLLYQHGSALVRFIGDRVHRCVSADFLRVHPPWRRSRMARFLQSSRHRSLSGPHLGGAGA